MSKPSKKKSLEEIIADLPDKVAKKVKWTMEQDALILKYAESKGIRAISEILGVSRSAAHARHTFLRNLVKK